MVKTNVEWGTLVLLLLYLAPRLNNGKNRFNPDGIKDKDGFHWAGGAGGWRRFHGFWFELRRRPSTIFRSYGVNKDREEVFGFFMIGVTDQEKATLLGLGAGLWFCSRTFGGCLFNMLC